MSQLALCLPRLLWCFFLVRREHAPFVQNITEARCATSKLGHLTAFRISSPANRRSQNTVSKFGMDVVDPFFGETNCACDRFQFSCHFSDFDPVCFVVSCVQTVVWFRSATSPRGLTFKLWGFYGLCLDINQLTLPTCFILFLCLFLSLWPFQLYFLS